MAQRTRRSTRKSPSPGDASGPGEPERVEVKARAELRAWLEAHHAEQRTIWLVTYKKPSPFHLPWSEVVDEALCFGYIDSLPRALDEQRTMLRLSPRSARSAWSAINQQKAARLEREGRMTDAGRAAVERAKQSGAWSRIDSASALEVPEDLAKALDARAGARALFDAFPKSIKRGILEWIAQAKRSETREKRVRETAEKAERNERANQWRP